MSRLPRLSPRLSQRLLIAVPFTWLLLFFLLPFVMVLGISFSLAEVAIPPYRALLSWANDELTLQLNFANYRLLGEDSLYLLAYWGSFKVAAVSTLLCLLLGYPMAYAIARTEKATQTVLLLLIMLPTWTALLIRVYAWMGILSSSGPINSALLSLGLIDTPLPLLNSNFAVYVGIVYAYLPFMVLPLYANLVKHDASLLEAAFDLGARRFTAFWRVTLPLSKNGMVAGTMLVFIPVMGEFVIPELLGGTETLMIGKVLWQEFFNNRDWPVAAALAVVMLLVLMLPILWFNHQQACQLEGCA
ncbi:MAG: ABC transporter permease subunit [Aeromonas sp.]